MSAAKKKLDFGALASRQVQRDLQSASSGPDRFERAQVALEGPPGTLDVEAIRARQQSTRELDAAHVRALAESIGALGLIEPVVVDLSHRLLAGGHRLEAIKSLRTVDPSAFAKWFASGVPVRVMEFDADGSPDRALEIEVAENEHRRDYTVSQVRELATRLKEAGYRETVGRPKIGERALGPALEVIVGKSMKTIRKLLSETDREGEGSARTLPDPLEGLLRTLRRQQAIVPEPLLEHLHALIAGLEAEIRVRQGHDEQ